MVTSGEKLRSSLPDLMNSVMVPSAPDTQGHGRAHRDTAGHTDPPTGKRRAAVARICVLTFSIVYLKIFVCFLVPRKLKNCDGGND
jgi:hypothetical protein